MEYQIPADETDTDCSAAEEEDQQQQEEPYEDSEGGEEAYSANVTKRKNSFVWKYFRPVFGFGEQKIFECIFCNGCVGKQTSNLARHLVTHNITREGLEHATRGRPSRSFIWKYCTKEDASHARCHSCQKLLFCGSGNTANIAKHLRRKHSHLFVNKDKESSNMEETKETIQAIASIDENGDGGVTDDTNAAVTIIKSENIGRSVQDISRARRERKGGSYVWSYCDKLSRHTIRCKLCSKVMSFHGTANVITHLQRRHNIVGKVDSDNRVIAMDNNVAEESSCTIEQLDDNELNVKRRRRSAASTSVVWKYCTRVGKDVVNCVFCKKNLSYQGTSNLQRHLHRMHGIVTQGRGFKAEIAEQQAQQYKHLDSNFIWEYCSVVDDDHNKCNLCDVNFDSKDTEEMIKHLSITHAILPSQPSGRRRKRRRSQEEESSAESNDYDNDDWSKNDDADYVPEYEDPSIKKDDSFYDDIIVEDTDQNNFDEDPFDPNLLHEYPVANPLSSQSSCDASPDRSIHKINMNSRKMKKLTEERVRMETEYFREKAGYYRMQKYLTALQAKKVRVELERLNGTDLNGEYAVDVGGIPDNAHTQ